MTHFRFRYRFTVSHSYVVLWVGVREELTHARSGNFFMSRAEWEDFHRMLRENPEVEFIDETPQPKEPYHADNSPR